MKQYILMGIVAMLLIGCVPETITLQETPERDQLRITGNAEMDVAPDEAELIFSIATNNTNPREAQKKNAAFADAVVNSLKSYGKVETTGYNMYETRECWDAEKACPRYYVVENSVKLTLTKLDSTGDAIDAAVLAGANRINSLTFKLSDKKNQQVKQELLAKAAENAKEKAKALAEGAGIRLGKVILLEESSYTPYPVYRTAAGYDSMEMAKAPTPIEPENVKATATVTASFEIN